ncbi:hypothetical protein [Plesiomonas shigelloides]
MENIATGEKQRQKEKQKKGYEEVVLGSVVHYYHPAQSKRHCMEAQ